MMLYCNVAHCHQVPKYYVIKHSVFDLFINRYHRYLSSDCKYVISCKSFKNILGEPIWPADPMPLESAGIPR